MKSSDSTGDVYVFPAVSVASHDQISIFVPSPGDAVGFPKSKMPSRPPRNRKERRERGRRKPKR